MLLLQKVCLTRRELDSWTFATKIVKTSALANVTIKPKTKQLNVNTFLYNE